MSKANAAEESPMAITRNPSKSRRKAGAAAARFHAARTAYAFHSATITREQP
jgi:hypothetical protein